MQWPRDPRLLASRTVRNRCVVFEPLSLRCFAMAAGADGECIVISDHFISIHHQGVNRHPVQKRWRCRQTRVWVSGGWNFGSHFSRLPPTHVVLSSLFSRSLSHLIISHKTHVCISSFSAPLGPFGHRSPTISFQNEDKKALCRSLLLPKFQSSVIIFFYDISFQSGCSTPDIFWTHP